MFVRAIKHAERGGYRLLCTEFGCRNTVDRTMRLAWYRDLISLFTKFGIGYSHWDYKCRNEFGIRDESGHIDSALIKILVPNK